MRMQSSVATSFGLKTLWMSNQNDRDSIKKSNKNMFKSKIQDTKTNKYNFTQVCHIKEIVIKHAILQCLSIRDQCMCILKSVWMYYTKCLNYNAETHMYKLCVCALMPCKRKKYLDTLASKNELSLLKTKFAWDVAFHLWSFFSSRIT